MNGVAALMSGVSAGELNSIFQESCDRGLAVLVHEQAAPEITARVIQQANNRRERRNQKRLDRYLNRGDHAKENQRPLRGARD